MLLSSPLHAAPLQLPGTTFVTAGKGNRDAFVPLLAP